MLSTVKNGCKSWICFVSGFFYSLLVGEKDLVCPGGSNKESCRHCHPFPESMLVEILVLQLNRIPSSGGDHNRSSQNNILFQTNIQNKKNTLKNHGQPLPYKKKTTVCNIHDLVPFLTKKKVNLFGLYFFG